MYNKVGSAKVCNTSSKKIPIIRPNFQSNRIVDFYNTDNLQRVCKSNESESVFMLCYKLVFHHKWADAQFFIADAQFFGADAQFFRADVQFFAAGLLWPINYAFCCCWTTFTLEIMVLCPTEHVQTLFTLNWTCANSVLGMCRNNLHNLPCFLTVLIDNYDTNLTRTETQTRCINHLIFSRRRISWIIISFSILIAFNGCKNLCRGEQSQKVPSCEFVPEISNAYNTNSDDGLQTADML